MTKLAVEIQEKIKEKEDEIDSLYILLKNEILNELSDIGIVSDSKVIVDGEVGIFKYLEKRYGVFRPLIAKIKKDGTAHLTNTVYCYKIEDMKLYKEV